MRRFFCLVFLPATLCGKRFGRQLVARKMPDGRLRSPINSHEIRVGSAGRYDGKPTRKGQAIQRSSRKLP